LRSVITVLLVVLVGGGSSVPSIIRAFNEEPKLMTLIVFGGGAILIVLALVVIGITSFIYYKRFLWEITETNILIRSGLIFKKQVQISFLRVQSIDFNAGIVERILGIVRLKIETAGGASNRGVMIPALKLNEAEALRAEVFSRKRCMSQTTAPTVPTAPTAYSSASVTSGASLSAAAPAPISAASAVPASTIAAPAATYANTSASRADTFVNEIGEASAQARGVFANDYYEDAPIEYEYGLTAKELLMASLSGDHNFVTLAVIIGFFSQIPTIFSAFIPTDAIESAVTEYIFSRSVPVLIAFAVGVFFVILVLNIIGSALQYGGFKTRRRGGRIEVERGLLQRQYKGVAIPRVQSIQIKQGFIRRLMGYAELRLITIDSISNSEKNSAKSMDGPGLIIHPFIKMNNVENIIANLIPEYSGWLEPAAYRRLGRVALRRSLVRNFVLPALVVSVIFAAQFLFMPYSSTLLKPQLFALLLALLAIIYILMLAGAVLWYRHAGFGWSHDMLAIRQGFYGLVTVLIPRRKIQWANTRQNPLQRLSGVATVSATTAGGVSKTHTVLRDLPQEDADAMLVWLHPRGASKKGA
jgi:putative membrane protein